MTDGILLKEVHSDLLLRRYSCIVLDEVHERNINTDLLLGLLSRAMGLRREVSVEEEVAHEAEVARCRQQLQQVKNGGGAGAGGQAKGKKAKKRRRGQQQPEDAETVEEATAALALAELQYHQRLRPLKLIIMSATLSVKEIAGNRNLFARPPPIVNISGRQHPVATHFSKRTNMEEGGYAADAFRKVREDEI
jgi:ATP-dependent RNA helicase DHX37/DHR1